jgi:Sulfotransferase family
MSGAPDLIIFVHVPKAGGSTIRSIMQRSVLSEERLSADQPVPALMDMRLKLFIGHIRFGIHQGLLRPVRYFTMLREPISRYVSDYFFAFQNPEHTLRNEICSGSLSLETTLLDGRYSDSVGLIRQVTGLDAPLAENVDMAVQVMDESYSLVGLMERFDESALLLSHVMGWGPPLYIPRNRTKMDPETRRIRKEFEARPHPDIVQRFAIDSAFYQAAERNLERSIALAGPMFPAALEAYRAMQAEMLRWVDENNPSKLYTQALFSNDDPLPAELRPLARTDHWRMVSTFLRADTPLRRRVPPLLHGRIEQVTDGIVKGWATRYGDTHPVPLLVAGAQGEGAPCVADIARPDLEGRGFNPAPRGYQAQLPDPVRDDDVSVFFENSPLSIALPAQMDMLQD